MTFFFIFSIFLLTLLLFSLQFYLKLIFQRKTRWQKCLNFTEDKRWRNILDLSSFWSIFPFFSSFFSFIFPFLYFSPLSLFFQIHALRGRSPACHRRQDGLCHWLEDDRFEAVTWLSLLYLILSQHIRWQLAGVERRKFETIELSLSLFFLGEKQIRVVCLYIVIIYYSMAIYHQRKGSISD